MGVCAIHVRKNCDGRTSCVRSCNARSRSATRVSRTSTSADGFPTAGDFLDLLGDNDKSGRTDISAQECSAWKAVKQPGQQKRERNFSVVQFVGSCVLNPAALACARV